MATAHLPRNNEIAVVTHSNNAADIKPFIEAALANDGVKSKLDPFLVGENTCGDKRIAAVRIADVVVGYDTSVGGNIRQRHLTDREIVNQVQVVLRRHYLLDKHGRYVSLNPKRYILLADKSAAAGRPSPSAE